MKLRILRTNYFSLIALWLLAINLSWAQPINLVMNAGFEYYEICRPSGWLYGDVPPWSASFGTPDYFNFCQNGTVPTNNLGFQYPSSGNGYMGIVCYMISNIGEYREFVQGKLSNNLQNNKFYKVSFRCSLANPPPDNSFNLMGITRMGIRFYQDSMFVPSISLQNWSVFCQTQPQIESPINNYLSDTLNWMDVSGLFLANGNESFFTIGNFNSITDTTRIYSTNNSIFSNYFISYYYLDDVSLTEIGTAYTATACNSYTWHGNTYSQSGVYTDTVQGYWGTDSLLQLTLTINSSNGPLVNYTGCSPYTYNGVTYNSSGTYTQTFTNWLGCDSVVTLNLNLSNAIGTILSQTACGSYTLNNQTYTTSGTYTQTLQAANGCDSTLTLNLLINNTTSSFLPVTACNSFTLNGQTYTSSGNYTQQLSNWQGCDSVLTLEIIIQNFTTGILQSGAELECISNAAQSYQWLQCNSNSTYTNIPNATTQTYTATANADYAVIATSTLGCIDTSGCVNVNSVGVEEFGSSADSATELDLEVYPNPVSQALKVSSQNSKVEEVRIYNVLGELVIQSAINHPQSEIVIDVSALQSGVYFVEATIERGVMRKKFVKE